MQFLVTNYPEEAFTSTFKAQARERFPKAAIYAPLSTVEEIRTAAALAAVAIAAPENESGPANDEAAPATA
jgi:hypothetical protein